MKLTNWVKYFRYKFSKKELTPEEVRDFDGLKAEKENHKFPCKECLVFPTCDFSKPCDLLEMDDKKVKDLFMKYSRCPDCGSERFHEGPSGGAATNVECGGCGHWFNMGLPLFIQRIHVPFAQTGQQQAP